MQLRDIAALSLLDSVVRGRDTSLVLAVERLRNGGAIGPDMRERLRDLVGEELVEAGFDESNTPTPHGLELEALIDWLAHRE